MLGWKGCASTPSHKRNLLFLCVYMCIHELMCITWVQELIEARRGHQAPITDAVVCHHVGATYWTHVLCQSNKCSYLLNYLSALRRLWDCVVCVCVCVCAHVHMFHVHIGTYRSQKRALQAVTASMWVLGTKPRSPARAVSTLSCSALPSASQGTFIWFCSLLSYMLT